MRDVWALTSMRSRSAQYVSEPTRTWSVLAGGVRESKLARMTVASERVGPSWLDRGFRLGYFGAYRIMRSWWRIRRPTTHGTVVAIWCDGEVLLVRQSYVSYLSGPGGYRKRGESARDAAVRELREELQLSVRPEQLEQALDVTHDWEGKRDHVTLFHLELPHRPRIHIDQREVVAATWYAPQEVRGLAVFPPLKRVIAEREASQGSSDRLK